MTKNNAHTESPEARLVRFRDGAPYEVVATLLNSINNYFNNELRVTVEGNNYQTSLLLLGIHAVALTISEGLFERSGLQGYRLFLEKFVDGSKPDTKFSLVADKIYQWRNVLAHQWLGSIGHTIGYDYDMDLGWQSRESVTFLNPRIYLEHYLRGFGAGGRIWNWESMLSEQEQHAAKARLIAKYIER